MEFREYVALRRIEIAEIATDSDTYTLKAQAANFIGNSTEGQIWFPLSGVSAVAKTVNESATTKYYDNMGVIVYTSEGNDEYTLTLSVLDKATKAWIDGTTYNNGVLVGTPRVKKSFAMRFIGTDSNGVDEFNYVHKVMFTGGAETYNTKTDSTEGVGVEYTATSVYTTSKDATVKKAFKLSQVEASESRTEEVVFADTVATPADLIALD